MVLIFSDSNDISTDEVIDWLNYSNTCYLRVNPEDTFDIHQHFESNNGNNAAYIKIVGQRINIDEIYSVWYRRGGILTLQPQINPKSELHVKVQRVAENEHQSLTEYLCFFTSVSL